MQNVDDFTQLTLDTAELDLQTTKGAKKSF